MARRRSQNSDIGKLWDENPVEIPLKKSKKRALILVTVIFFGFSVIVLRLVDLMVVDHEKLSKRAAQQYMREQTLTSPRGAIWDRQMREMATNIETESLYAQPSKLENTGNLSRELARHVNMSSKELNRRLIAKKNKDFLWIERKMEADTARKVQMLLSKSSGSSFGFVDEAKRYYPKGQTASHILGFANIDNKGIAGLELKYNEYLTGEASSVSVGRDARGNRLSGDIKKAVPGNNLILTIDESIQYIVERELSNAMKEWKAKAAVAIMMDPMTGEILAMANRPTYDPNDPGRSSSNVRRNRAITDLFEPGSTFKSVLAAAALEEKVVRLHDRFDVSKGFIVVGGKTVHDVHKNEVLSFQEIIQKSSNVGAVQVGLKLGSEKYYRYMKSFGFGEKTGIDFPGEVRGILRNPSQWSGTSLAAMSIGQEIGVTPLQILRAYATIANGGALMKPYIVSDIISPAGDVIKRVKPEVERRVVSADTANKLKDVLKMVVEEGGTATKASIDGNLVAGKTGTAQIFDPKTGRYSRDKFVSSFVGFAPADDPKLALIVVVYEPEKASYGGVVAAPVFKKIIEHTFAYLDIPMETDENRIYIASKSR